MHGPSCKTTVEMKISPLIRTLKAVLSVCTAIERFHCIANGLLYTIFGQYIRVKIMLHMHVIPQYTLFT